MTPYRINPKFNLSDTALLAQSRFILLESMMILFSLLALLSVLKMRKYRSQPFSLGWFTWLTTAAVFMGLAYR
jgi:dolichyl-phosphate-mannose--protein O-mannosyl transferase